MSIRFNYIDTKDEDIFQKGFEAQINSLNVH